MTIAQECNSTTDTVRDPKRLVLLRRTGILEAPSQTSFDRLTRLATRILDVPMALVSLVDAEHQYFVSCVGGCEPWARERRVPLTYSFCPQVVRSGEPLIVEDARAHPLVRNSEAITALGMIAYAGVPLTTCDGNVLGSFCAVDHRPRAWSAEDISVLRDLAASAVTEIELRLSIKNTQERAADVERERNANTALLQSTTEGMYGIDNEGRCTFFNWAASAMTRYEPEEVLGQNMHALIHHTKPNGEPYPEEECPIYQALQENSGSRSEDDVVWRRDGTSFPAELTSAPIIDGGMVRGAVVTISNITRRKQLEQLRDDLTHMIVHDLRTPLTSLLSGLQTLGMMKLDAGQQEMLDISIQGGNTLLGMVNDLLDISKSEGNGTLPLEYAPVNVSELADAALQQVRLLAQLKGITLVSDVDSAPQTFDGDGDKLTRTLVNLLGNALKFTPGGGQVTLGARACDSEIVFFVKDTGEGIPAEAFGRIFEKFGQVEDRKMGRKMSTGLGLTFCKMAVEAHGGRIWVESERGLGSTFSFALPITGPAPH